MSRRNRPPVDCPECGSPVYPGERHHCNTTVRGDHGNDGIEHENLRCESDRLTDGLGEMFDDNGEYG